MSRRVADVGRPPASRPLRSRGPMPLRPPWALLVACVACAAATTTRCPTQPDRLTICGDLTDNCAGTFCPTCNRPGVCDTTCGFCLTTTSSTMTSTTTTTTATSTTTTSCYSVNFKADEWCEQANKECPSCNPPSFNLCPSLFCPTCPRAGQCDGTCGYCTTTTTTTSATSTTTTTTATTSSSSTRSSTTSTSGTRTSTTGTATTATGTASTSTTSVAEGGGSAPSGTTSAGQGTTAEPAGDGGGGSSTPGPATAIVGTLSVRAEDPAAFCQDPAMPSAITAALALASGVAPSRVSVVGCSPEAGRRLAARRLAGVATVSYRILVAAADAADAAVRLAGAAPGGVIDAVNAELQRLGSAQRASGVAVAAPAVQATKATTTPPSSTAASPASGSETALDEAEDVIVRGAGMGWYLFLLLGAAICVLCALGCIAWCCLRRKRRRERAAESIKMMSYKSDRSHSTVAATPKFALADETTRETYADDLVFPAYSRRDSRSIGSRTPAASAIGRSTSYCLPRPSGCCGARPPPSMDEASDSTLATSASAFWRDGVLQRRVPLAGESFNLDMADDRFNGVSSTREGSPHAGSPSMGRRATSRSVASDHSNAYFGHWLQRGDPDFAASIKGNLIKYQDGGEQVITFVEDGAVEVRDEGGERRRGRLLGEDLLWDNGDVWTRARSAAFSWRMADWAAASQAGGSDAEGWRDATGSPYRLPGDGGAPLEGVGLAQWEINGEPPAARGKASDRCYTC